MLMTEQEFDDAVEDALDRVPEPMARAMDNVVVLVEDEPEGGESLLGLYDGTPLTARGDAFGLPLRPDYIFLFRGPLQRACISREELVEQIRITVVHEVAHHLGIDDRRLHELGWG